MALNHIELQGYLGRDPEIDTRTGQKGEYKIAKFSIGVSRDIGDGTDWFNCSMMGKRAEVIDKYFHKGSEILVSGRVETYKTDRDNVIHTAIRVEDFHFTSKGSGSNNADNKASTAPAANPAPAQETMEDVDDDVPF